jgi:hypothetical protein
MFLPLLVFGKFLAPSGPTVLLPAVRAQRCISAGEGGQAELGDEVARS